MILQIYDMLYREVWPDDVFGTEGMDMVEQRDVLKKIFLDPVSGMITLMVSLL